MTSAEPGSVWCGVSLGLWVGHRVVVSELPTKVTHSKDTHAMTQDHSALLAQLDALTSADSGSMFAELVRAGLQALIEAEATEKIGAGPSCGRARSFRCCWNGAAVSTRRCMR